MGRKTKKNPKKAQRAPFPRGAAVPAWRGPVFICAGLLLAVFLVYGRTLAHGFVNYDDPEYVLENPMVNRGLSGEGFVWAFTRVHSANWHPVTWLSHQLDCQVFGLHPWGHHLVNLLLHAANAILVFLLLWRGTGAMWRAAFVAAVFAAHPLRAESVAWVTERKDVLSALFWLLATGAYGAWARRGGVVRYLLVALFLVLGLLSKPMVVTLPFTFLLLDIWPLRRVGFPRAAEGEVGLGRSIVEKLPLFAIALALAVITFVVQRRFGAMEAQMSIGLPWRLGNAAVAAVAYIGKLFWPQGLAVFYPHPGATLPMWKIGLSVIVLLGVTVGAVAMWPRRRYVAVGWFWYLGTLAPVIGIVQVGAQAMADRYTYLPTLGLLVIAVWGLCDLVRPAARRQLALAGVAALLALGVAGWRQAGAWRSSIALFEQAIANTTGNSMAHNNLAVALDDAGQTGRAIDEYRRALAIDPEYPRAHYNLANALRKTGAMDEAVEHYRLAAEFDPGEAQYHANLGATLEAMGRLGDAAAALRKGIEAAPGEAVLHFNLGNVLRKSKDYGGAEGAYRRALELCPGDWEILVNLGSVYFAQGRFDAATDAFEKAAHKQPTAANLANVALARLRVGRYGDAAQTYAQIGRMEPDRALWPREQARALVRAGRADEARAAYDEALRRARRQPGNPAIEAMERERAALGQ